MKTFIKKNIIFILVTLVVLVLLILAPVIIIKKNARFKLEPNITSVVLGHSHPECAFNDTILSNFKNLSSSGESYFYNYQKLKTLLDKNKHIKTVFIEFSNNQISGMMDEWIWGYEKMSHYLPVHLPFIDKEDLELLYRENPKDLAASVSIAARKNIYALLTSDYNYIDKFGGYKALDVSETETLLEEKQESDMATYPPLSSKNLLYLRKMVDLCKLKNIAVYLVRSPQHKAFEFLANEALYQDVKHHTFDDVELLDFNTFSLPNDHFADLGHLNSKGATVFSNWLDGLLNNGLLSQSNKKELITNHLVNFNSLKN